MLILIDFVYKNDKSHDPQAILEECGNITIKNKAKRLMTKNLFILTMNLKIRVNMKMEAKVNVKMKGKMKVYE